MKRSLAMLGLALFAGCNDKSAAAPQRPDEPRGAPVSSDKPDKPDEPVPTQSAPKPGPPSSTPAPRAKRLELIDKKLTDAQLEKMIADGKVAPDVVELDLSTNQLTARALELLAKKLNNVQSLAMHENPLGDDGAKVLARETVFRGVNQLGLGYTKLTLAGFQALFAKDSKLTGPVGLLVEGNPIGDAGLDALLASRFAPHIQTLGLSDTGITDASAKKITLKALPNLSHLDVTKNKLSPATVAALRKLKMDLRVEAD
jgi:Leucine-rich repeat (LRR) protein